MEDRRTQAGGHLAVSPPAVSVVLSGMAFRPSVKAHPGHFSAAMSRCPKVRSELILFKCWVRTFKNTDILKCPTHPLAGWQESKLSALGHVQRCGS